MSRLLPFSAIKPDDWPPALRRLHDLRQAPRGPLQRVNVAVTWRAKTFKLHSWNVAYFVGWLKWSGRIREDAEFKDYVSPEVMAAYVEDMRAAGLSSRTIATRVDGVRAALAALSPEVSATWLMYGINKLRTEPSDRRRTQARTQHTARIVELGVGLMRQADDADAETTPQERAVLYRDGLIIVFMALVVPRLDAMSMMLLGQHLIWQENGFSIAWSAEEMKGKRPCAAHLGPELSELIQRYLDRFRPILSAKAKAPSAVTKIAVWLNKLGQPLRSNSLYKMIVARTGAAFDTPMFPHAFRHSAATSLVLERPDLIKLVTPLLQHRAMSSREYYVLADRMESGQRYGETLIARRSRGASRRAGPSRGLRG